MVPSFFEICSITREIRRRAVDGLLAWQEKQPSTALAIQNYLRSDLDRLEKAWPKRLKSDHLSALYRHVRFGKEQDYHDMLKTDIPGVEVEAERHFRRKSKEAKMGSLAALLHPVIMKGSWQQFERGLLRDAVLNGIVSVFDSIRKKTGSKKDGAELIGEVFSLANPRLILSDLKTESGQSDQKGFLQIFQGAYLGIRNPKAHTLDHDLDILKASQYLVFFSVLARRVEEAKIP